MMAHTLEITFNSFEDFDEKFLNLKRSRDLHNEFLEVTFTKKDLPQIENIKNLSNGNIEFKRSFKKI